MTESMDVSANLPILEKLQYSEEKNLIIQGLPSSVEKSFIKLSYSKNLTPLLKNRKVDFALIFSVNQKQLNEIVKEVVPYLAPKAKFWVAFPKKTSKIATDLNREGSWDYINELDFKAVRMISLDHIWSAIRFKKSEDILSDNFHDDEDANMGVSSETKHIDLPKELEIEFESNTVAAEAFEKLAFSHKKEYIVWIKAAKKMETRERRINKTIEMLEAKQYTNIEQ